MALLIAIVLSGGYITHVGFSLGHASTVVGYMMVSLACIGISIWKNWDFEIVGWTLLGVFFLGMVLSG